MKTVIYTVILNNRDQPKKVQFRNEFDYVLFTDDPTLYVWGWDIRLISAGDDPVRTARYYKHNPIALFPNHENSIWLDATHYPIADLTPLIDMLKQYDICCMKHHSRNTSLEEAEVCIKSKMDDSDIITRQIERYQKDGFQDDLGLFETSCLVRKHCQKLKEFQDFWWNEILTGSRRDQLSFMYSLWKTKTDCGIIPGYCRILPSPFFDMVSHYPNGKMAVKML